MHEYIVADNISTVYIVISYFKLLNANHDSVIFCVK